MPVMATSPILALGVAAIVTSLIVLIRYLAISGFFAWVTKLGRPGLYRDLTQQIHGEIKWSAWSAVIYGAPFGVVLFLWLERGMTQIYTDPAAYPLWYLPVSVLLYLFIHDTWFFWTHRWMHIPKWFRRVHYVHHLSHPPTAWAAMSFHPWEALSGAVLIPVLVFLLPIHVGALGVVVTIMSIFGVTNHMGWEIIPQSLVKGPLGRLVITASHHDQHHRRGACNYGLYFRIWDYVCGTDRGFSDFGGERPRARGE
jgi:sterol desaturase/sphingolipid hydroxylase (fatty acid hydroxylase superfamily)